MTNISNLPDTELIRLSALIDNIYQGALDPACWNDIVPEIAHWLRASSGLLHTPLHPPEIGGYHFSHGISDEALHLWRTRWSTEDLVVNEAARRGLFVEGNIVLDQDVVPHEKLRETPIYREFLHPNQIDHLLGSVIFDQSSPNGMLTVLNFYRNDREGAFTAEECKRMQLIMPHISRAFGVMAKFREADAKAASSMAALERFQSGVMLLNECGEVVFANVAATKVLKAEDGLSLIPCPTGRAIGTLSANNAAAQQQLHEAIRRAVYCDILGAEHFSLGALIPRPSGKQPYVLRFSSLPEQNEFGTGGASPKAIVFITDHGSQPVLDTGVLSQTYRLTAAEIRLAQILAECVTPEEAAQRLGLSMSTIKTQLQSIYNKTGTNNRVRLMKLLVSLSSGI